MGFVSESRVCLGLSMTPSTILTITHAAPSSSAITGYSNATNVENKHFEKTRSHHQHHWTIRYEGELQQAEVNTHYKTAYPL